MRRIPARAAKVTAQLDWVTDRVMGARGGWATSEISRVELTRCIFYRSTQRWSLCGGTVARESQRPIAKRPRSLNHREFAVCCGHSGRSPGPPIFRPPTPQHVGSGPLFIRTAPTLRGGGAFLASREQWPNLYVMPIQLSVRGPVAQ
jgi:hypothetical protein